MEGAGGGHMSIGPIVRPTKMAACSTCTLVLPIMSCELCMECHCEMHIAAHINKHFSDAELFKTANKLADQGVKVVQ